MVKQISHQHDGGGMFIWNFKLFRVYDKNDKNDKFCSFPFHVFYFDHIIGEIQFFGFSKLKSVVVERDLWHKLIWNIF